MRRVAVNLAISSGRRRVLRRRFERNESTRTNAELEAPDPGLRRALLSHTPAQRAAVVLRYYVDRSVEEIANDLGKRTGTVRALTAQGLARLRERLSDEEMHDDARR